KGATVSYPDGITLKVVPLKEGYSLQFSGLPASVKSLGLEMPMPLSLGGKATFAFDDAEAKAFPEDKPEDPFLFKGDAKTMRITGNEGGGFVMTIEHGWQQLQDNRVWNGKTFWWKASADMPRTNGNQTFYSVRFGEGSKTDVKEAEASKKPNQSNKVSLTGKGVAINAGSAGTFTLGYPIIEGLDPKKPTSTVNHSPTHTSLTYADGVSAEFKLVDGHQLKIDFAGLNGKAQKMRMEMHIPFTMAAGGKYAIGRDEMKDFPSEKPAKPFLFQGSAEMLSLKHPTGPGLTVSIPKYSFMQLQDNREWNWNVFVMWFSTPLGDRETATFSMDIGGLAGEDAAVKPVIDRYGQWVDRDFPAKVQSDEELKQDAEADRAYYASLNPPTTDSYGGFPGTGEKYGLKKTGFFHLGKIGDADVLVTPEGNAFFQLGVCCLTPCDEYTRVAGREKIYEWLPAKNDPTFGTAWKPNDPGVFAFHLANMIRKTGRPYDMGEYAGMWIDRERKWGFNSLGAFASTGAGPTRDQLLAKNYPYVAFLPLGGLPGVPGANKVWDPFTDGIEETLDKQFAKSLEFYGKDPLLIGFFIANEPSVEEVPKVVPMLKASESASKRRLMERLREKYGEIGAFNRAWKMQAESFEQMGETALVVSTAEAAADVQDFFAEFLDRRYGLVNKYFRKYDPNHLLIGDRWMPGTSNNELMVRTAGKYLDIVSINYYTYHPDKGYLDRIHEWSGGRPMLLSEFYFSSTLESGLQGGMRMATQRERGLAYRHYVEHAAGSKYIVGVQWFLNMDQASTGRFFEQFNGEANNTGLVSVADRPYKDFLAEVMKTNYDLLPVLTGERNAYEYDDPRFQPNKDGSVKTVGITKMAKPFKADGIRTEWPMVPPSRIEPKEEGFEASFRVAWDEKNLYLYIEVVDSTPMCNDMAGPSIWNGDAVELFVGKDNLDQRGTMIFSDRQVLIRGARSAEHPSAYFINAPQQYDIDVAVVRQTDGKGYVVEAAIPFTALGFEPKVHQELMFDLAIDDSAGKGRFNQLVFNGTRLASKDRGVWGRAQLLP
ncbi:MAG: hypothetical protein JXM70_04095, partial [Pirellulales bacterium]|nr:hypothetical protein [Pirellulales bacterium]